MTLYSDLGIEPTASKQDIEKAYRKKAMKEHPDHGGDPHAFKQLTVAYKILKDEESRKRYDETGRTDTPLSKRDTIFRQLIIEGFTRSDSPINSIIKKLQADQREIEQQRDRLKAGKKQISRRLEKFLEKNNVLENECTNIIKETLEATIVSLDREIDTCTETLDMLKGLIDDFKVYKEEDSSNYSSAYPNMQTFARKYFTT